MRAARLGLWRGDLPALVTGGGATVLVLLATQHSGAKVGAGFSLGLIAFAALIAAWLLAPHLVIGCMIPLFAVIPTAKLFVSGWLGPVKDAVTLAAGVAVLIMVVRRHRRPDGTYVDSLLCWLVLAFGGLYLVNLGGTIAGGGHGIAWAQGFRLVCEPLILLLAGLLLPNPRRSLHVALVSLIATGVAVALYGIYQQYLGGARLVALGYSYQDQVRTIGGHLRSFGTLDDPFAYAAFLLLAISAAIWWMQRGPLKTVCVSLMAMGLLLSYVRSAILIAVALAAIWLIKSGRAVVGVVVLVASVAAAFAFLVAVSGANETHSVRAGPNTYITLNGLDLRLGDGLLEPRRGSVRPRGREGRHRCAACAVRRREEPDEGDPGSHRCRLRILRDRGGRGHRRFRRAARPADQARGVGARRDPSIRAGRLAGPRLARGDAHRRRHACVLHRLPDRLPGNVVRRARHRGLVAAISRYQTAVTAPPAGGGACAF